MNRMEQLLKEAVPKMKDFEGFSVETLMKAESPIYRFKTPAGRYYFRITDKGIKWYLGTTSVIQRYSPTSPHLLEWYCKFPTYEDAKKYVAEASAYGTFLHIIWGLLLKKETIDFNMFEAYLEQFPPGIPINTEEWKRKAKQDVLGFIHWLNDWQVEPLAIEEIMYDDNTQVAGTVDLICNLTDPKKSTTFQAIVDFKSGRGSSFYEDNKLQLYSYAMLSGLEGIRVFAYGCKDFRIPVGKTVQPYRFQEFELADSLALKWNAYISFFHAEGGANPSMPTVIKNTMFNRDMDVSGVYYQPTEQELTESLAPVEEV